MIGMLSPSFFPNSNPIFAVVKWRTAKLTRSNGLPSRLLKNDGYRRNLPFAAPFRISFVGLFELEAAV
jgi:hypothetical protein